ncbi:hypothetical protein SISNIDRAFT_453028 [Sistotremastrum niveocremeum HHB9708]|uniref:Uncharacterized protein n=1 Tax=Sistotremastrum niveocremeum HHB9708 TaxID=1314777 RepID=A0A164WA36_9AGAM|nr:hypothetical protein SISNIDRAFT_453028 [Sistotremastrum niveocremeum HHB9708]
MAWKAPGLWPHLFMQVIEEPKAEPLATPPGLLRSDERSASTSSTGSGSTLDSDLEEDGRMTPATSIPSRESTLTPCPPTPDPKSKKVIKVSTPRKPLRRSARLLKDILPPAPIRERTDTERNFDDASEVFLDHIIRVYSSFERKHEAWFLMTVDEKKTVMLEEDAPLRDSKEKAQKAHDEWVEYAESRGWDSYIDSAWNKRKRREQEEAAEQGQAKRARRS